MLIVIWINWTISQIVIKIIIALLRLHDNKFSLMKILMKLSEEMKEIYYLVLETFFSSLGISTTPTHISMNKKKLFYFMFKWNLSQFVFFFRDITNVKFDWIVAKCKKLIRNSRSFSHRTYEFDNCMKVKHEISTLQKKGSIGYDWWIWGKFVNRIITTQ